jgi:hypothetical protein
MESRTKNTPPTLVNPKYAGGCETHFYERTTGKSYHRPRTTHQEMYTTFLIAKKSENPTSDVLGPSPNRPQRNGRSYHCVILGLMFIPSGSQFDFQFYHHCILTF